MFFLLRDDAADETRKTQSAAAAAARLSRIHCHQLCGRSADVPAMTAAMVVEVAQTPQVRPPPPQHHRQSGGAGVRGEGCQCTSVSENTRESLGPPPDPPPAPQPLVQPTLAPTPLPPCGRCRLTWARGRRCRAYPWSR